MQRNSSALIKVALKTKIILIIGGFFLFLVLLETGLRLGGFILLSRQEHRNRQSIKQKSVYRIMCLGESTTQGQYPPFLEKVLNQRNVGGRFSVVDKGRTGMNTHEILNQVESYLDEYHPDLVVTMMGINDWGKHVPREVASTSKITLLFKSLKTYKLTRLLWLHILTKAEEIGQKESPVELIPNGDSFQKARDLNHKNDNTYVDLGVFYQAQGKYPQAGEAFRKAINLNPKNDNAYIELGWFYRAQNKYPQAEEAFRKAIELNPKNDNAYRGLGWFYQAQGKFFQAEDLFQKAIDLTPKKDNAYCELGWFYQSQEKFPQAKEAFQKALEINPKNGNAYRGLGRFYQAQGKFLQVEEAFRKAIDLTFKKDNAYCELGFIYQEQGKYSQAKEAFKKAVELNPENDSAYGAILVLHEEMGKPELAKEYAEKASRWRVWDYNLPTVNNYRKLKEILDKRGIRLVCAQYPLRSIGPLKEIFEKDAGVIFVDNESVFKAALKTASYKEYFRDMFGGDFGHCTEKGNRLLAENIAEVILKEAFGR